MSTEIITPNTRINRYSDFRLVITMTKDGEAYVPAQFRFIFYVEDWADCPGRYTASCIKGITTNCAVDNASITVFFNAPNFNLGQLKCRFYDMAENGNFADGTLDTCTPVTLPVEIVSGAGDAEVVNISVQYAGSGSIDIDTSDFMTKSTYTYPIDQLNPRISGKIQYWAIPDQAVDYIDGIGDAHIATTGTIYGAANGNVYMSKRSGEQLLYSAEDRVIFNKEDGHLYTYDGEAWTQVGGSSSGGEGTVTGVRMNGTTHEPTDGVVNLGTVITQHQDISGKANSADLATVATSGSYNDLTDKPVIPEGADLSNYYTKTEIDNKGYLTTETDPTVPSWAKTPTKPTYTAQEVGALPANTSIPSKTSDLTNDSGFINRAMYYGLCESAASAMPKVCTVETFPTTTSEGVTHAKDGTIIAVKFTNSDTNTTDAPTLNVNNIGAKAIMYNNAIVTSTAKNTTVAGYTKQIAYYRYDPSLDDGNGAWEYLGKSVDSNSTYSPVSLGFGYATQSNSSASATITATLSSYALTTNGIVSVKFNYDVPASATLNINSKGAKAIYNRGAAIAAGVIKAGDTATFIYSTYYHLISIDRSDSVTVDSTITQNGTNPVQGGAIYSALEGKEDAISDLAAIRSGAAKGATALQPSDVTVSTPSTPDGTFELNVGNDTYTINLNHTHPEYAPLVHAHSQYAKVEVVNGESNLPATLDPKTIYGVKADGVDELEMVVIGGYKFYGGGGGAPGQPVLMQPAAGSTVNIGTVDNGYGGSTLDPKSKTINIKARNITQPISISVSGTGFSIENGVSQISAADAIAGTTINVLFDGSSGSQGGTLLLQSTDFGQVPLSVDLAVDYVTYEALGAVGLRGTQWIQTDYIANPNTNIKLVTKFTPNSNTRQTGTIGNILNSTSDGGGVLSVYFGSNSDENNAGTYNLNIATDGGVVKGSYYQQLKFHTQNTPDNSFCNKGTLNYSGTSASFNSKTITIVRQTRTAGTGMVIGKKASEGGLPVNAFYVDIYSLEITESGTTVRNYVPIKKSGVPGLYDTVHGTFHSSETDTPLAEVATT